MKKNYICSEQVVYARKNFDIADEVIKRDN
jgi:Skp family chaperone for outer membrane proteins